MTPDRVEHERFQRIDTHPPKQGYFRGDGRGIRRKSRPGGDVIAENLLTYGNPKTGAENRNADGWIRTSDRGLMNP